MDANQRFVVISDVHGFYDEMIEALNKANFNPETDILISLGDEIDRGPKPQEVIDYLMSLPKAIFVKGNHQELMEKMLKRGYPLSHDWSNGTMDSVLSLAPNAETASEAFKIAREKLKPFFDRTLDYVELRDHILVHSFVPLKCLDGLPQYYTRDRKFEVDPDWRNASAENWAAARWGNPHELARQGLLPDKTLVVGHFHTSWPRAKYEGKPEWGDEADFSPYYGDGYIAIDACTAYSGKVNVIVLEDDLMEDDNNGT